MSAMTEEHTGGMIALIPRAEDAAKMVVDGGDPVEEMHLTLTYLGDDVTTWDAGRLAAAAGAAGSAAAQIAAVSARVMGHGVFNPDGHADREPCAVYLVGDSAVLSPLRAALVPFAEHEQHEPFIPHVTAGFGVPVDKLSFTGDVVFDRLRVALGPQVLDFPLGDAEEIKRLMSTMDTETKGKMPPQFAKNAAAKKAGAGKSDDKGGTADKGINNIGDLAAAVKRYKAAKDDAKAEMWPKIKAAATKLNATKMIAGLAPKGGGKSGDNGSEKKLFEALELEFKVTSEDPRAAKMRKWWALSPKGRGYWKPGVPGDFKRLVRALKEHTDMPARMIKGFAANVHHLALGAWPGREGRKEAFDWLDMLETKAVATGEISGDAGELLAQYKEARAALDEALGDDEEDDDPDTAGDVVEATGEGDGGESPEEVYDDAMDTGIDWNLAGDGTLTDPDADGDNDLDSPSELGETSDDPDGEEDPDDAALEELEDIFSVGRASA
jgi:hypothetical protein